MNQILKTIQKKKTMKVDNKIFIKKIRPHLRSF